MLNGMPAAAPRIYLALLSAAEVGDAFSRATTPTLGQDDANHLKDLVSPIGTLARPIFHVAIENGAVKNRAALVTSGELDVNRNIRN